MGKLQVLCCKAHCVRAHMVKFPSQAADRTHNHIGAMCKLEGL